MSGFGLIGVLAAEAPTPSAAKADLIAYVGTFTGPQSKGIYAYRFDAGTGSATPLGCVAETVHPAFLALHPTGKYLYAVNEVGEFDGKKTGAVSAFAVDRQTGRLKVINQRSSGGPGPCHLAVDHTGRHVLVANYSGGSVAVLPIREDGSLGETSAFVQHTGSSVNPQRQREPHAHSVNLSPDNRFAFVADLGIDQIRIYRFDAARGSIEAHAPPSVALAPGAGPRHFAFHPGGRWAYVINELLSTVTRFDYDAARGVLTTRQAVSTLPEGFTGRNSTAEVVVHPSGRFLYGSNRGHDSLAVYAVSAEDGSIEAVQHVPTGGQTPRNFALDPTGRYLWAANQGSNSIHLFRVEPGSGKLAPTGQVIEVGSPVCVRFLGLP